MKNTTKKLVSLLTALLIFCALLCPAVAADQTIPAERQLERVYDAVDLLTDEEEALLLTRLNEISERQNCDVAVVTVYSLDGKSVEAYTDDFYDYNGYGMGEDDDGILLLISMEYSDWCMTTYNYGAVAFTDAGREHIADRILPYLSDGDFYEAFDSFASYCDMFLTQARTGEPYDSGNLPKEKLPPSAIFIALFIGAIVSLIITLILRGSMKSVRSERGAARYEIKDSFFVNNSSETYLYQTRKVTPKVQVDSDRGGGSSTHRSSSGRSHSTTSGKF